MKEYLTCQEVADYYKVKKGTVWRWVRKKQLPATKIGKEYRVSREDLEQFERNGFTIR